MSSISIAAGVHTHTTLSQQMMQSLQVLQMNGHELQEFLAEESRKNPFLNVTPPRLSGGSDNPAEYAEEQPCLYEDILRQIYTNFAEGHQQDIAIFYAERLDEHGFCPVSVSHVAQRTSQDQDECEAVLKVLRGFEPEGVFSANFWDYISYRMHAQGISEEECEKTIAALPHVPSKGPDVCADNAGIARSRFKELLQTVKKLRTPPASHYALSIARTRITDCYVTLNEHREPIVSLNADAIPLVRFAGNGIEVPKKSLRTKEESVLHENMSRARNICDALERRSDTLMNVVTAIVRAQRMFFTLGESYIVPLTLSKIADIAGVHESTVSRTAKEKTLSYKGKLYDLKFFFGSVAGSADKHSGVSTSSAKHRLRFYVDSEHPAKPYSDEVLAKLLAKEGICISRRTVMKYRSALGIPSSASRKRINSVNI